MSAFISIFRFEVTEGVARLNRARATKVIVPNAHKGDYVKNLYELDHHFQRVINSAIFALVDCLIPGNVE